MLNVLFVLSTFLGGGVLRDWIGNLGFGFWGSRDLWDFWWLSSSSSLCISSVLCRVCRVCVCVWYIFLFSLFFFCSLLSSLAQEAKKKKVINDRSPPTLSGLFSSLSREFLRIFVLIFYLLEIGSI
ncbi:hypothetical protein DM02DRAFT_82156 [Periconia macrospinosa]|uniref:Uncharacterized protein n=1 Tax=Periconia macrospinosa TaxID=97972 RepID=A0A2V1DH05_9PLEO|nr:hypothetical protein DM02DRAFT_82156 [Periconia macrospinosa]